MDEPSFPLAAIVEVEPELSAVPDSLSTLSRRRYSIAVVVVYPRWIASRLS